MLADFMNVRTPFFKPMGRRVALVAACLLWALFEFSRGALFWGLLFGASGLYCAWQFFVNFPDFDEEN